MLYSQLSDTGKIVARGSYSPQLGDIVFFNSTVGDVYTVGIVVGKGVAYTTDPKGNPVVKGKTFAAVIANKSTQKAELRSYSETDRGIVGWGVALP